MNNIKVLFGAPGCGKTTTLVSKLKGLLSEYGPDEIAYVSFTRKGSHEGRDRALEAFPQYDAKDFRFFRTLHSLAFMELGATMAGMMSRKNYRDFSKAMGMNFIGYYTPDFVGNDDRYLFQASLERNNIRTSKIMAEGLDGRKLEFVRTNYRRFKDELGLMDFDDLMEAFIKRSRPIDAKVAIIDEAQDLTSLQWAFCEVAFGGCEKVYMAGDDDQAIYEWSGADVGRFLNYASQGERHILKRSYRLRRNILGMSKKISGMISSRVEKSLEPSGEGGGIYFHNSLEDIQVNSEETYYFLSRNNYFLGECKSYAMKMGLLFEHKGRQFFRQEVYDSIRKYEKMRQTQKNARDIFADPLLGRFIKRSLSIANGTPPWFEAFDLAIEESNYYRDLFKNKTDPSQSKVSINTIHGVKGGEADNVVLLLDMNQKSFSSLLSSDNGLRNMELRVLYVGLTRARKNLHIVFPHSKLGYDRALPGLFTGEDMP